MKSQKKQKFRKRLLEWYEENGRHHLEWRGDITPFHSLIAEFLLQQTQASQVEEVFPEFIEEFSEPEEMAEADIEEIKNYIGSLGLEYRARRIKEASQDIVAKFDGEVPEEVEQMKSIHGVGDYIARSVAVHSFGESMGIIDTNTSRIISRVFGYEIQGRARTDKKLWEMSDELTPEENPSAFTYAMLDLGAEICTSSSPSCGECPLNEICDYYNS